MRRPDCPVCNGLGWLTAAPVINRAAVEGEKSVVEWGSKTLYPCFNCGTTRLAVLA